MTIVGDSFDSLPALRDVIIAAFPELASESFVLAPRGWDSAAVDVGDRLIFKFPRHEAAAARLRREARLLAAIRPRLATPVPDMTLFEGPPLFSRHSKLAGEHLTPDTYETMSDSGRERVASQLALFYAELHALDRAELAALGVGSIGPWLPIPEIARSAVPRLPEPVRPRAIAALDVYGRLPSDPARPDLRLLRRPRPEPRLRCGGRAAERRLRLWRQRLWRPAPGVHLLEPHVLRSH